jgi:hypothetical protein
MDGERFLPFSISFFRWRNHLRKHGFDLYIDLSRQEGNQEKLLSHVSGAVVRMSHSGRNPYFNCEISCDGDQLDEVKKHLKFVSSFLPESDERNERIPLFLSKKRQKSVRDFLRFQGVQENEVLLGVDMNRWNYRSLFFLLKELKKQLPFRVLLVDSKKSFYLARKRKGGWVGKFMFMKHSEISDEDIREELESDTLLLPPHLRLEGPEIINACDLFLSHKTDYFSIAYALEVPTILLLSHKENQVFHPPRRNTLKSLTFDKNEKISVERVFELMEELLQK